MVYLTAKELVPIVRSFEDLAKTMKDTDDTRPLRFYAEYAVALKLAQAGFKADVRATIRGHDLETEDGIRIEVKSGKMHKDYASASFGDGSQVTEGKFDYCVFVPFGRAGCSL